MTARDSGASTESPMSGRWNEPYRNPLALACDGSWSPWCRLNENSRFWWSVEPTDRVAPIPWLRMNMKRGFFEPPKCRPQDLQLWPSERPLLDVKSWIGWKGSGYFVSNCFSCPAGNFSSTRLPRGLITQAITRSMPAACPSLSSRFVPSAGCRLVKYDC